MNEPKYSIGDTIPGTPLIVRGVMTLSDGSHRYFLQIAQSNNSVVMMDSEIHNY